MSVELDINRIMEHLPHRFPFLLVDRVIDFQKNKRLTAFKNVTYNEPFFQGHFPTRPVMPGVLIVEALAQAGGLLAYLSQEEVVKGKITYVAAIDKVKFRKPVVPGDRLELRVEIIRPGSRFWKIHGDAFVEDRKAAEADMMAALQ